MQRFTSNLAARVAGTRTIMQLSAANPVLKNNAEARGFGSPVWVEEGDDWWFNKVTSLRAGEMPTECKGPARIELYNVDQLSSGATVPAREVHGHHSLKTEKRYSGNFNETLDKFAKENKLDSKWWLSPVEVRKRNLRVQAGATPCVQIIDRQMKMYNADQFANPEAIAMRAYSGATGRAYDETIGSFMRGHAKSLDLDYVVYFTAKQLDKAGLSVEVGSSPVKVPLNSRVSMKLFPIEAVDRPGEFLEKLQRFPVSEPTYVISGMPLDGPMREKAIAAAVKSNYWVSENEVKARGFSIKPDMAFIAPDMDPSMSFDAFHLEQLVEDHRRIAVSKIGRVE
eukprot:CAMPEP_0174855962 /NCGR_PEP_ID=MMETSP1114-20130205/34694_1 /TAXON_ID=312471 /ORGANISM="Neobodo designis, Strain CCAP 1951/1" /LENGTH=339 /DNA_ID=CAMNT_0016090737 /DNA_START=32 /DNA_END=1051 /DNA_ORIENTATION=+